MARDEQEPCHAGRADIVLVDDLGSAGAAVNVDDILDATPMTSETSPITSLDATPAVAGTYRDGFRRDLGKGDPPVSGRRG